MTSDNSFAIFIVAIIISLAQIAIKAMVLFSEYISKPKSTTSHDVTDSAVMCALHDNKLNHLESNISDIKSTTKQSATGISHLIDIHEQKNDQLVPLVFSPPGLMNIVKDMAEKINTMSRSGSVTPAMAEDIRSTLARVNRVLDRD